MTAFTGWLAHLDVPTVDGRILVTPAALARESGEWPVWGPGGYHSIVGRVDEVWIEDGWLRCRGVLNVGALPIGYRVARVGAEIDVDGGDIEYLEIDGKTLMQTFGWYLTCVVIGDRPAWPDARLELEL